MTLYNIKTIDSGWQVTKFDDDLNVESSYSMHNHDGKLVCSCPAAPRPTCRHRQMFDLVCERVDSPWFLDFDTRAWVDPTGQARAENEQSEAEADGPQGSLGPDGSDAQAMAFEHPRTKHQSLQGHIDAGVIKFVEGTPEPDPIVSLPDSHPFRRRL